MLFRHEISYDAPLTDVFAMLSDPAFREASARAQDVISTDVAITPNGAGISVRIDQVQPTTGVPGFAKKFAGDTTRAVQTEEWDSPAGGSIAIETPGKPTSIRGTLALSEAGGRTTETMEAEIKVKVPLIGGKLESLMADLVAAGMDKEQQAGVAWLSGHESGGCGMKKVHEELRYDGATLEQVYAMLGDPAFREEVCDFQGVLRHHVQIQAADDAMTVEVDQHQSAKHVPAFAKRFVGEEINIVQTEEWTAPHKGNIHVAIPGKPGEMTGTAMLTEDPDGTTETVNLSVKVNIPLVGGKIEGLIADLLSQALRAEHKVGRDYLAR